MRPGERALGIWMQFNFPMSWRRGKSARKPSIVRYVKYALLVVALSGIVFLSFRSQFAEIYASLTPKQRVTKAPEVKLPDVVKLSGNSGANQLANQPTTASDGTKLPTVVRLGSNPA